MNLEHTLPSQAKSGLSAMSGLSSSAQGDASKGKNSSFLQILRPKTGLKTNAVAASDKALAVGGRPVAVGQGASTAKASGTALANAKPTGSIKEPRKALNKLFGDVAGRAGQALKKTKKQSGDFSVPAVPLAQALEHPPSKVAAISIKKQHGIASGNLAKPTLIDAARGQAEKGSHISILRESSTPFANGTTSGILKKGAENAANTKSDTNKANNPLPTGKTAPKTKTSTHLPTVGRISGNRETESATEKTQNKRTSVIAAMPKAANKSGGDGSRINEGTTRRTTTTRVSVPDPITNKTSVSKDRGLQGATSIQSVQIHKTVVSPNELNKSPELKPKESAKTQPGSLSTIAELSRSEKTTPLGQAGGGGSPPARFDGSIVESRAMEIKLSSSESGLKHGAQKTNTQLTSHVPQKRQQLHINNLPQPPKSLSGGVGNKFDALAQPKEQNPLFIKQTIKGDQSVQPDTVTRKAPVPISRERLPINNRLSTPNTPYPVREMPRQSYGLEAQKTELRSLHSFAMQQTVYQTVTALKPLPVSKAGLPVSRGGEQKKTIAVTSKPDQRHRKLTHAALAKKPPKPAIAHAKAIAGGMEDAFLKLDMNLARKMEQLGNPRQNLPYGELVASREVGNHASVASEMIEAGRSDLSHIKDITVRNDFANRLNQADVELQSLQAKSNQPKGQSSLNAIVYRQVMSAVETFRGMSTGRWGMTIEPSHDLRIQLDLRMSGSQLVVQAKLERGAQAVLGSGWSELQASLAEKDVDLRSLTTANPKEGHSNMFEGKKERHSGNAKQDDESWFSEELTELLAEFEKEAQGLGKAKRNRNKARMAETNFESWA